MLLRATLVAGLLLAAQAAGASAGTLEGHIANRLHGRYSGREEQLHRRVDHYIRDIERRQNAPPTTPQSGNAANVDLTTWNAQTQEACLSAMGALNGQASNPSGMAVCYNLPFFDNTTGVFQAELRIYRISDPTDVWVGVGINDISLTLSYLGAQVESPEVVTKRDHHLSWPPVKKRDGTGLLERQSSVSELKVLNFVCKLNRDTMSSPLTQARLQSLLMPNITLSAVNPNTQAQTSTTLSSTEASFVNGLFARQAISTADDPAAQASASALAAQVIPLVIPGLTLAFFPTGLVITMIWTGLFFIAVGLGTMQRLQYREQYRRRMQRQLASGIKTI